VREKKAPSAVNSKKKKYPLSSLGGRKKGCVDQSGDESKAKICSVRKEKHFRGSLSVRKERLRLTGGSGYTGDPAGQGGGGGGGGGRSAPFILGMRGKVYHHPIEKQRGKKKSSVLAHSAGDGKSKKLQLPKREGSTRTRQPCRGKRGGQRPGARSTKGREKRCPGAISSQDRGGGRGNREKTTPEGGTN